ncbi:MAG: DUF971 domain-containing protein [Acidobacteriota bacterium]
MTAVMREVMVVGTDVVVLWADGHESYFPGEALRKACTCAGCRGEQHLFGRATLPTLKPPAESALVPVAVGPVGNYGIKVTWGDGHDHGIYHLDQLRAACPCPECAAARVVTA